MIILPDKNTPRSRLLLAMHRRDWTPPSVAQATDQHGVPNMTFYRVRARLNDGHVHWVGWFDCREDFDAFLYAIAVGDLAQQPSIWRLPTPNWDPGYGKSLSYDFATQVALTSPTGSSQTYTKPVDWNNSNNSIEVIAGGGGGGMGTGNINGRSGAGGGAYGKILNFSFTGTTASYQIGDAGLGATTRGYGGTGGNTWFNGTSLSAASVSAEGGKPSDGLDPTLGPGAGGAAANGIGTTKYSGGTGGGGQGGNGFGGGGGGAAGPNGAGNNGSAATGGSGDAGFGGAGGAQNVGGSAGTEYGSYGSGGGAGGSTTGGGKPKVAGLYGAGGGGGGTSSTSATQGGDGTQGLILVTYQPLLISGFNMPVLGM